MADTIKVMIVDDIAETREQLRKLLSFDSDIEVVAMVGSGEEAIAAVEEVHPDVIMMDVNLPGIDGIAATSKVIEKAPTVQVVMLSVQGETDYLRRAMMAGARDYLTKPPSADEMIDAIRRAHKLKQQMGTGPLRAGVEIEESGTDERRSRTLDGKIVTVYSPKGGTGCTTLAVNLAIAIRKLLGADSKVCLIDGSLQFGDVSIFMKLQVTRTLADLAPHAEDLDPNLLNTVMVSHGSGVKVLVAPDSPEQAEIFREGGIEDSGANRRFKAILDFARSEFDYVIVDTAHQVDDVLLAVMDVNDLLLLVTRPVIPEIRGARLFVQLLQKLEYDLDRLALLINGVDNKRMGIQPEAIERAMMPALAHLPLDERTALRSANLGEPVMMKGGRTDLGQAVTALAKRVHERVFASLSEEDEEEAKEPQRRAGLGRLL
ncbi:MAG: response regulator [Candidatus Lokiarchaeota archaeon]|nr:response regulator [Candidatus Lokiarchaeota archaeon]